jgi:hypothetical protein
MVSSRRLNRPQGRLGLSGFLQNRIAIWANIRYIKTSRMYDLGVVALALLARAICARTESSRDQLATITIRYFGTG